MLFRSRKSIDGDSADLEEIIMNSFGENRLADLDNQISKKIGRASCRERV